MTLEHPSNQSTRIDAALRIVRDDIRKDASNPGDHNLANALNLVVQLGTTKQKAKLYRLIVSDDPYDTDVVD